MQKIRFVAREKPDARPDSKSLQKENSALSVTLVIYGDEERYYYFTGQGHHVSPFYPSALCHHRYPRVNLIAQSSGEPVTSGGSGGSEGKVGNFADGGRAIGCKLFKTIQAKLPPVDAAAEAPLGDLSFDQPQAPLSRTVCNELCPGERLSKGVSDGPPPSSFWLTDKLLVIENDRRVKLARPATSGVSRLEDRLGHFSRPVSKAVNLGNRDVRATCMEGGCTCDGHDGDAYPDHRK